MRELAVVALGARREAQDRATAFVVADDGERAARLQRVAVEQPREAWALGAAARAEARDEPAPDAVDLDPRENSVPFLFL